MLSSDFITREERSPVKEEALRNLLRSQEEYINELEHRLENSDEPRKGKPD